MSGIFELFMGLPLFSGVTHKSLAEIIGEAKFDFLKYASGDVIIRAGEECTHLVFIISGKVRTTVAGNEGRFSVSQTLTAPSVIAPEFLFGRTTRCPSYVEALTGCSVMRISKTDYVKILRSDPVFVLNYLNMLSADAQMRTMALSDGSLVRRIAFRIVALTQFGGTDITMTCSDFPAYLDVSRENFESAVVVLESRGLVEYDHMAGVFCVPDRRNVQDFLNV